MSILSEAELTKTPAYSREFCAQYFGRNSSAKLASDLMKNSPETYKAVRAASVQHGLVDVQREHPLAQNMREQAAKNAPRQYSDDELLARASFSESECRQLLTKRANDPGLNLGDLAKDSARYAKFKTAAISYGLLASGAAQHAKTPTLQETLKQQNDTTGHVAISDSLADSLRLPRGTKVEPGRLSSLISLSGSIEAAREALKAEAEQVTTEADKL